MNRIAFRGSLIACLLALSVACRHSVNEPERSEKDVITFRGRAFLAGQPAAVNQLHLPLHYDIEIISFLPGDSASYDTTYTDSSGVYTSTRLRKDGKYIIVSRYPYYTIDTVQVEVKNGEVSGEIPRLFSQRLERIQIFPDSSVYHSLQSSMFFTQYITNFSMTEIIGAPKTLKQFLVPKNNPLQLFFVVDPNITYLIPLHPLEVQVRYTSRGLINFYDRINNASPVTGSYYLYSVGQSWSTIGAWYPHYRRSRHWWFKVAEAAEIQIELE